MLISACVLRDFGHVFIVRRHGMRTLASRLLRQYFPKGTDLFGA